MKRKIVSISAVLAAVVCLNACASGTSETGNTETVSVQSSAVSAVSEEEVPETVSRSEQEEETVPIEDMETEIETGPEEAVDGSTQFAGLQAAETYHFPVIAVSSKSSFWDKVRGGMDRAGAELGVSYEVLGIETETDLEELASLLSGQIEKEPPAIGLAMDDPASISSLLTACREKGIPVVMMNSATGSSHAAAACTVSVDNGAAGASAAENMYRSLQDRIGQAEQTVRLGVVCQDSSAAVRLRTLGFINCMIRLMHDSGKTVGLEGDSFFTESAEGTETGTCDAVIEVLVSGSADAEGCSASASEILGKEDTIGIFGSSQTAAEGILQADSEAGTLGTDPSAGDVIGVGFDSGKAVADAIKEGRMLGAVTQLPDLLGYYSVYAMTAAANGSGLSDISSGYYWYDADTISEEQIAQNLYE